MRAPFLLLLGVLTALPALAGQVFVPFVAADPEGANSGRSTGASVGLYNRGAVARRYPVRFLPAGATGGGELVQAGTLQPGSFAEVACCESSPSSGVLIVSGAPQIAVAADVDEMFNHSRPNSVFARLPVLTVKDALPAGGSALLQGISWSSNGVVTGSLGILNLGSQPAHCAVTGFGPAASSFSDLLSIVVPAGSTAAFPDVIGQRLTPPPTSYAARPSVTCDQPFFPFAIQYAGDVPDILPVVEVVPPSVPLDGR